MVLVGVLAAMRGTLELDPHMQTSEIGNPPAHPWKNKIPREARLEMIGNLQRRPFPWLDAHKELAAQYRVSKRSVASLVQHMLLAGFDDEQLLTAPGSPDGDRKRVRIKKGGTASKPNLWFRIPRPVRLVMLEELRSRPIPWVGVHLELAKRYQVSQRSVAALVQCIALYGFDDWSLTSL